MLRNLIQPGGLIDSVLRLWWIVLGFVILAVAGAIAFSVVQEQVVPARGQIVLTDVRAPGLEVDGSVVRASSRVADETLRILSDEVITAAASQLGIQPAELRRTVTARPADEATAVMVDGRMGTATASADRVNALIGAYQVHVQEIRAQQIQELTTALEAFVADENVRIAELEARLADVDGALREQAASEPNSAVVLRQLQLASTERSEISVELNATRNQTRVWQRRTNVLNAQLDRYDGGIDFVRLARGASGPPEPNLRRNVALALALGLILGVAVSWTLNGSEVERRREMAQQVALRDLSSHPPTSR